MDQETVICKRDPSIHVNLIEKILERKLALSKGSILKMKELLSYAPVIGNYRLLFSKSKKISRVHVECLEQDGVEFLPWKTSTSKDDDNKQPTYDLIPQLSRWLVI